MGISNKLRVLFVGVNFILPAFTHALIIEPVKIDSSQGEPLYAEIPFHNASNQSPLQVAIAQPFELGILEVNDPAQFSHFNFYVRQNAEGNGVIVITSSRPLNDNALNLVLKINDNGQVHMQELQQRLPSRIDRLKSSLQDTPLQPRIMVDEKDIELNLPTSSLLPEQQLVISQTPPPMLATPNLQNNKASSIGLSAMAVNQNEPNTAEPTPREAYINTQNLQPTPEVAPITAHSSVPEQTLTPPRMDEQSNNTQAAQSSSKTTISTQQATTANEQKHRVEANESLWAIANRIAKNQRVSINSVMQDIQQNNQHAFINGDASRLKQGVVLNIPPTYTLPSKPSQPTKNQAQTATSKLPATITPKTPLASNIQNDAHMSIVANTHQGTIQGAGKTGEQNSTSQNELSIQLKQARSNTVTLQNNVRQLDQQLKNKEQRIALLNARLAELEQILKSREAQKSQTTDVPNTTSKSQGVIPAIIAGTLVAVSAINSNSVIATLLQELV